MTATASQKIKSVVVTGASTGIGKACALYLDKLGWRVFAGVRKPTDADALEQQSSSRLTPIFVDVTRQDSVKIAAENVSRVLGDNGLAGLVNNAGIALGGPLEFLPIDKMKQQLDINVIGQLAVTQAFLPLLRQGQGRIVNMSSISGRVATPFLGPYAASKFALESLTDSLRGELLPWGIDVVSVQPGAIATPIWDKSLAAGRNTRDKLPPDGEKLYGQVMDGMLNSIDQTGKGGIPADEVAKVVHKALIATRPKTRYLVGRDAKIGALLAKILPDRWRDWALRRSRS